MLLIDIAGIKPKKTLKQKIKETIYKTLKRIIKITKNKEKYQKKLIKIFASTDYQNLPNGMHQTFKNIINEDLTNYIKLIPSECLIIWGKQDTSTPLKDAGMCGATGKRSDDSRRSICSICFDCFCH